MQTDMPRAHLNSPSILIILMGALGDVARGLCLVSHIKSHWPQCRITWLVEPKWAAVVGCHPEIDRIIVFDRPRGLRAIWPLYKELREETFDITLDLQRHLKSGIFSFLSRAGRRVGFHHRNAKELNWLFNTEHIGYTRGGVSKIDLYVRFASQLGLPAPTDLDFGFSALGLHRVRPELSARVSKPYLAVVMGSSWESKDWVFDGYRQLLADTLAEGRLDAVLLGDRSQSAPAARLMAAIGESRLIDLVGKTTLVELIALLKSAAVAVGPDSGPGHLAGAVGTPYVSLFGPTDPRLTAPYGSEHLVVKAAADCGPCYKRQCPTPERWCMRRIDVDQVKATLSKALGTRD